jgi:hypothetical protein
MRARGGRLAPRPRPESPRPGVHARASTPEPLRPRVQAQVSTPESPRQVSTARYTQPGYTQPGYTQTESRRPDSRTGPRSRCARPLCARIRLGSSSLVVGGVVASSSPGPGPAEWVPRCGARPIASTLSRIGDSGMVRSLRRRRLGSMGRRNDAVWLHCARLLIGIWASWAALYDLVTDGIGHDTFGRLGPDEPSVLPHSEGARRRQ